MMARKSNAQKKREEKQAKIAKMAAEMHGDYDPDGPVKTTFETDQQTVRLITEVRAIALRTHHIDLTPSEVLMAAFYALYDPLGTQDELAEAILYRALIHRKALGDRRQAK